MSAEQTVRPFEDHFEIDTRELHYPNIIRMTLHNNNKITGTWPPAVGSDSPFNHYFYSQYHDVGVLWTSSDIVYEVDGEPVAAIHTNNSIQSKTDIRFSTALMDYVGTIPEHPEHHHMCVQSLRVYPLQ
jgi:hypothetical protein